MRGKQPGSCLHKHSQSVPHRAPPPPQILKPHFCSQHTDRSSDVTDQFWSRSSRSNLCSSGLFWTHWLAHVQSSCNNWRLHQTWRNTQSVWYHRLQDNHYTLQPDVVDYCGSVFWSSSFRTGNKAALRTARAKLSWELSWGKAHSQRIHSQFRTRYCVSPQMMWGRFRAELTHGKLWDQTKFLANCS